MTFADTQPQISGTHSSPAPQHARKGLWVVGGPLPVTPEGVGERWGNVDSSSLILELAVCSIEKSLAPLTLFEIILFSVSEISSLLIGLRGFVYKFHCRIILAMFN